MGRRKYWPIYEACAKHGLHVMSHAFGSYGNPITGTGWPSFYLEDHVGPAQAMQANVISMVAEGVFERFPGLKLRLGRERLRLDSVADVADGRGLVAAAQRGAAPQAAPSEYIREHVYLTTQPIEEPHKPQQFFELLEHYGDMVNHILFASDYPHWDSDDPDCRLAAYACRTS